MDVSTRLPTMEDGELAILRANAERLMRRGTPAQKASAAVLVPSIIAELAGRSAVKHEKETASSKARVRAVLSKRSAAKKLTEAPADSIEGS
ncbi:MAG: hypothetical protein IPK66_00745 [Rhodospirillales bacterium]|nr:hypothetical protein [Rhodospirillales bacterium]